MGKIINAENVRQLASVLIRQANLFPNAVRATVSCNQHNELNEINFS